MEPAPLLFGVELTTRTVTVGGLAVVAVLVGLSGFFSSAEIALFSLADYRVEAMVAAGLPGADRVRSLKADPHRLLVTILVGNNVVNIAMASISTAVVALHLPPAGSVVATTFGVTALVLLFGESAPKSYAVEHGDSWARRIAGPLQAAGYAMYPLVALFDVLTRQVNRLTGTTGVIEAPYVTRSELQQLVELGERQGVLEAEERELLVGVLQFRNRIAKEVMRSRLDVTAVEAATTVERAIDVCLESGHDRLPVYEGTLDAAVGVVELRDLLVARRGGGPATVGDLAEPVLQIPETKDVDELLVEMREEGHRLAIVVDEFGTTQGLVTVDDVVAEIVGDIVVGVDRPAVEVLDDRTARVRGDANVHELNERLGTDVPEDGVFETVAGFVIDRLGRIPAAGDAVERGPVRLEVERMDGSRVAVVRATTADAWPGVDDGDAAGGGDGDVAGGGDGDEADDGGDEPNDGSEDADEASDGRPAGNG